MIKNLFTYLGYYLLFLLLFPFLLLLAMGYFTWVIIRAGTEAFFNTVDDYQEFRRKNRKEDKDVFTEDI